MASSMSGRRDASVNPALAGADRGQTQPSMSGKANFTTRGTAQVRWELTGRTKKRGMNCTTLLDFFPPLD